MRSMRFVRIFIVTRNVKETKQNPREGSALNAAPCDDEPAKGLTSTDTLYLLSTDTSSAAARRVRVKVVPLQGYR